ncbi:MAG: nucleotide exchange factor GrpE [Acidobacteriota bacterium]
MGEEQSKMVEEHEEEQAPSGQDEQAYELDLESGGDAEEAMRSALDAVEKKQRRRSIPVDDGEPAEAKKSESSGASDGGADAEGVAEGESAEAAALKTRLLRTLADFDNYRKRTDREKETLRRFAVSDVIKDVLGVIDNLERALAASGTIEELKQGLEMILRQQSEVMKRYGVESIDAVDCPFDPTLHEAVAREDSPDVSTATVIRELQKGYMIHDRLLRPSMVHVAMPAKAAESQAAESDDDESGGSE